MTMIPIPMGPRRWSWTRERLEHRSKRPGEMILNSIVVPIVSTTLPKLCPKRRMEHCTIQLAYQWRTGTRCSACRLQISAAWCNDQWHYCGIVVTLLDADGEPDSIKASLWGIESDGDDYHEEAIGELIFECMHEITATIGEHSMTKSELNCSFAQVDALGRAGINVHC